jgi:hypothetical protein
MNQKSMELAEQETYRHYRAPGNNNMARRAVNTVCYAANNTCKHELAKAVGALMLHKWGEIKFNDVMVQKITELAKAMETTTRDWPKQKANYITECVPRSDPSRRVDLLRLVDDYRFEFETDHKEVKDFKREKTITIPI